MSMQRRRYRSMARQTHAGFHACLGKHGKTHAIAPNERGLDLPEKDVDEPIGISDIQVMWMSFS
jgi:hypothetical protein